MDDYLSAIERYGSFRGRSSRREFWIYNLIQAALQILSYIVVAVFFGQRYGSTAATLVSLFHVLPSISITVRRLHDTDRSGGWFWIPLTGIGAIVLFVFMCEAGTPGDNHFGRDPRHPYGLPRQAGIYTPTVMLSPGRDPITELERLAKLRADGSLSEAEYQMMKTRALARFRS